MLVVSRFRVPSEVGGFVDAATAAAERFRSSAGCQSAEVVQNLDEPELWALVSSWADVGSYRRAFNGTEAKLVLIPLLSLAIDEPSAYDEPNQVGLNRPRGTLG
ncbi:antibiotic biosynthesis monooxygenase [Propionicimonas paludicola]|uniref:Antibiotic biosynthesis monooxygenase n=1 Tax=Propionicimonas paludicola TaxID=185243 RepID=A0A2A9CPA9_9ACTN|nr:antibiotic biosynthesis monooxygenase family protein [Propionicimonas paludicola]PFG16178.1 antibiotic biosynthesis monooxygenase [Propionicimonas paludicola]